LNDDINIQPTPTAPVLTIPEKLVMVENILNGKVLERRREIETGIVALVAGKHHCQIGPPGIGKTFMVDELHKLVEGARYFRWLMTRFTTPEELFGPVSLKELEQDHYVRHTDGKLPEANIAFLDEKFKGNSSILNSLLSIQNEGLYFNNGTPMICKPIIFSASNEYPKDAELGAMWDRDTFRHLVKGLQSNGSRKQMLRGRAARAAQAVVIDPVISWPEIVTAQEAAAKVEIPEEVYEAMIDLWTKLRKEGIEPTDRRFNDCIPVIQACAYRAGRSVADVADMQLLRHVLPMDFSQQGVVDRLVLELANPLDVQAMKLIDQINGLTAEVHDILAQGTEIQARRRKAVEINGKLTRLGKELDTLEAESRKSTKRSSMITDAKAQLGEVVQLMLGELFGLDEDG
jgi:MoxR-like ATPase